MTFYLLLAEIIMVCVKAKETGNVEHTFNECRGGFCETNAEADKRNYTVLSSLASVSPVHIVAENETCCYLLPSASEYIFNVISKICKPKNKL